MHKFVQQISNYMKIMKVKISLLTSLLLVFYGCEKTVIAYPGNNQSTTPSTPIGAIQWDNNFPSPSCFEYLSLGLCKIVCP